MEEPHDNLDVALDAHAKGLVPIPCHPRTKIPSVRWKEWQTKIPPEELIRLWFRHACNVAIVTTGMVVFDCDDPEKKDLIIEKCGETSHMLKSPRGGVHLGYRRRKGVELTNKVKIKGLPIDIRTDGGLELLPNSETEDGRYEWLGEGLKPIAELPLGNIGWTRERIKKRFIRPGSFTAPPGEATGPIKNPEAYCLRVESIQGQNGSKKLVRCVCVMRDAGRSPQQTFDFLWGVWNTAKAFPPWSEGEIWHAINRFFRK